MPPSLSVESARFEYHPPKLARLDDFVWCPYEDTVLRAEGFEEIEPGMAYGTEDGPPTRWACCERGFPGDCGPVVTAPSIPVPEISLVLGLIFGAAWLAMLFVELRRRAGR